MADQPRIDPKVEQRIRRMLVAYERAQREIEKRLRDASTTPAARFRLGSVLDDIRDTTEALNLEIQQAAQEVMEPTYDYGAQLSDFAVRQQGGGIGKKFTRDASIHRDAVTQMARAMTEELVLANQSLRDNAERAVRATRQVVVDNERLQEEIAAGLIEGEERRRTSQRIERRLREALEEGQRVTVQSPSGTRHYDPRAYSELVTRTMTRDAVTLANVNRAKELGQKLMRVSVHDGACEFCQLFQGKVFSLDGETDGFPQLEEEPPYHPNCGHVLTVFVPTGRSEEELESLRRISQDKDGRIHDFDDYQRVRAGGKLERDPKEFDEESRRLKRERRQRMREGHDNEDIRPVTIEGKRVSQHESDQVVRDLVAGDTFDSGDISRIQSRAVSEGFKSKRARADVFRSAKGRPGDWSRRANADDFERAVNRLVRADDSGVTVTQRDGEHLALFTGPSEQLIREKAQGDDLSPWFVSEYSADRAEIINAYTLESLDDLPLGEESRRLR